MRSSLSFHPTFRYANDIEQICRPLKKLNITYFAHIKITNGHQFSGVSSNPIFIEHYLKNKYYTSDIHQIDEAKVGKYVLWDAIDFTKEGEQICIESAALGVHNPFTIIKKQADSINYYHFANNVKDNYINQVYLSNVDLLELFIAYFHERIQELCWLQQAYEFIFDMNVSNKIVMTPFGEEKMVYDEAQFFRSITLQKHKDKMIQNITLSNRQNEILHYIVMGKTIKETAKLLKLSPRTVGHYFETIKDKFNVQTKSELISKTIDTKYVKLFMKKNEKFV